MESVSRETASIISNKHFKLLGSLGVYFFLFSIKSPQCPPQYSISSIVFSTLHLNSDFITKSNVEMI
jgi:hypothetical protein